MTTPVYNQNPNLRNRPIARKDAQGNIITNSFQDLSFRGEYLVTELIFKGLARPGSDENDSVWQIAKLAYDPGGNLISVLWPQDANGNASSDYQFSWSERGTYTYS